MMKIATFLCLAVALSLANGHALEKTVEWSDPDDVPPWDVQVTCTVVYYNYCTGWVWNWGGWGPNEVVGQAVETCCSEGSDLVQSRFRVRDSAPAGYGFTGSVAVHTTDPGPCPGSVITSQTFLPTEGWQVVDWGSVPVPSQFVVTMTFGPTSGNPARIRTDHPSAGPTGPDACGYCYPLTRVAHAYQYGTVESPLCPGIPFDDPGSTCDEELLWDHTLHCAVAVNSASWGRVKSLYR